MPARNGQKVRVCVCVRALMKVCDGVGVYACVINRTPVLLCVCMFVCASACRSANAQGHAECTRHMVIYARDRPRVRILCIRMYVVRGCVHVGTHRACQVNSAHQGVYR